MQPITGIRNVSKGCSNCALIIAGLIFLLSMSAHASAGILEAHKKALKYYKESSYPYGAIRILEQGGVKSIIDKKPNGISLDAYINILNDYAFFLSEDDEMYTFAIPILKRVIDLAPKRDVAYLNLGDAYVKWYRETDDEEYIETAKETYRKYADLLKKKGRIKDMPVVAATLIGDFSREAQAADEEEKIFDIAKGLHIDKSMTDRGDMTFCSAFLMDVKKHNENVKIIQPILRTDFYNDPNLQSYLKKCPKMEANKLELFEPDGRPLIPSYGKYGFRLYDADLYASPTVRKQNMLFYYEGDGHVGGLFRHLDLKKCEITEDDGVRATIDSKTRRLNGNLNGILKYKDRFYIYSAEGFQDYGFYTVQLKAPLRTTSNIVYKCYFEGDKPKGGTKK